MIVNMVACFAGFWTSDDHCFACVLQAILVAFDVVEPSRSALVAEMVGFDPELVMPELKARKEAAALRDAQEAEGLGCC